MPVQSRFIEIRMGERKAWTKEEDQALVNIIVVRDIKKWSHISKTMESEFHIYGRSGKQCRERWHNQLDPSIKNSQWTLEEERILFKNHNVFGNKWARISQELEGRTDNCVKNHFYSTLRRAFRRLNQFIVSNKQRLGIKELKTVMMSKVVAAAEDKFINKLKLTPEIIEKSIDLKNRLLPFSKEVDNTPQDEEAMETLIREILQFTKSYKRKKARKPKSCQQRQDEVYNDEQISVKQDSENQDLENSQFLFQGLKIEPKQQKKHQDLFGFSTCQVIVEKDTFCEVKQSQVGLDFIHRQDSKIIQDDPLQMFKKGSTFSNWSGINRLPSLRQRNSEFSYNKMDNSNGFFLEGSLHIGNLFGFGLEQLN